MEDSVKRARLATRSTVETAAINYATNRDFPTQGTRRTREEGEKVFRGKSCSFIGRRLLGVEPKCVIRKGRVEITGGMFFFAEGPQRIINLSVRGKAAMWRCDSEQLLVGTNIPEFASAALEAVHAEAEAQKSFVFGQGKQGGA